MFWEEISSKNHESIDRNIPVLLNIASIEQHGPALPVVVDSLIGWELCLAVEKQLAQELLVLPQLKVCYSQHHMDFAGSLTVSHEALLLYLSEMIESVIFQGYKNIFILNSHGGNQGLMQVLIEKIGNKHKSVNIMGTSWWKLCSQELTSVQESGFMGNGHAAEFEFSLAEYLRKDLIDYTHENGGARPDIGFKYSEGDLLQAPSVGLLRTFKEMTQDGTYGLTDKATAEKGEKIFHCAVANIVTVIQEIKNIKTRNG